MEKHIKLEATQVLVLGFALVIAIGTALLMLPVASEDHKSAGFIDSLFTATSAVCVTGLVVRDTADSWTMFGEITILLLIQIGGLGFMTLATMLLILMGRRIRLRERLIIQEQVNGLSLQGMVLLIKKIMAVTFVCELIGAVLLSTRFIPQFGAARGLYMSIFHSISAFCNAGFDIMGEYRSLMDYTGDFIVCLTIMALIIVGGLGFSVVIDVFNTRKLRSISLHSKVVLLVTALLLLSGFAFFLVVEWSNPKTLGDPSLNIPEKALAAMFQSVTPRTAGFNTISQSDLTTPGKFMTIILMFIGASPAGTGGGIKTTTFAVVLLMVITVIQGRAEISIFNRRLARGTAFRSVAITFIAFCLVVFVSMVLSLAEQHNASSLNHFENLLYETVSAFGTVGLSTGITPTLTNVSKTFLILTMFIGRLGPLTMAFAFFRRFKSTEIKYRFPEGRISVG